MLSLVLGDGFFDCAWRLSFVEPAAKHGLMLAAKGVIGDYFDIAILRFSSILSRKPVVESHFWFGPTRSAKSFVM